MYLKHNTLGEDIPLVIALKAMGLESDQEIIQLIGIEPDIVDLFSGSLEEPYNIGVYTQQQVLKLYWKVRHGLEHAFYTRLCTSLERKLKLCEKTTGTTLRQHHLARQAR